MYNTACIPHVPHPLHHVGNLGEGVDHRTKKGWASPPVSASSPASQGEILHCFAGSPVFNLMMHVRGVGGSVPGPPAAHSQQLPGPNLELASSCSSPRFASRMIAAGRLVDTAAPLQLRTHAQRGSHSRELPGPRVIACPPNVKMRMCEIHKHG